MTEGAKDEIAEGVENAVINALLPDMDKWLCGSYQEFRLKSEAENRAPMPEGEWSAKKELVRKALFKRLYEDRGLPVPEEFRW